jgi:hypothetical protein
MVWGRSDQPSLQILLVGKIQQCINQFRKSENAILPRHLNPPIKTAPVGTRAAFL